MRRIESIEDEMRGSVTYEIGDGRWITLTIRDVREYGLEALLSEHGVEAPKERVPVFQGGRQIGTVPATFEPMAIKSKSFFYDARPGDFKRTREGWEAARALGPGDLHAVPGFEWGDPHMARDMEKSAEDFSDALLYAMMPRR